MHDTTNIHHALTQIKPEMHYLKPRKKALKEYLSRTEAAQSQNTTGGATSIQAMKPTCGQKLLHEFEAHQIEFNEQNAPPITTKLTSEQYRERIFDLYYRAPVGCCSVDASGMMMHANLTLITLLGLQPAHLDANHEFAHFIFSEDQDRWYAMRHELITSGALQRGEFRLRQAASAISGQAEKLIWVQLTASAVHYQIGAPALRIGLTDIGDLKDAQVKHVEGEARFCKLVEAANDAASKVQLAASVFEHAREGIMITDSKGATLEVNEAFTRITGYSRSEALGQNPRMLSSGRQSNDFYRAMWSALTTQGHWSGEIWNRRKGGEVYAELLTISAVRTANGDTQQYVSLFTDITAIKEHQGALERIAHFDALTNLPNRLLLADRLKQAMVHAQRRDQQLAVVFLDLDGFKGINDRYGHHVGDQFLTALANAMKDALREGDTLARIGGDEFVAVLIDLESADSSVPMLKRLLAAAAAPVHLGDLQLRATASVGVTFFPQEETKAPDQLLREADHAMYQAKLEGKNRYHLFSTADSRKLHDLGETAV